MTAAVIMGVDLATQTGFCVGRVGGAPTYGTRRFGNGEGHGAIFNACMHWMADMITVHEPRLVLYEAPLPGGAHKSPAAGRVALGLAAMVEAVCDFRSVICREAHNKTVRAHVLGKGHGNASKEEVLAWCRSQGWTPDSLDASDACGVWRYGCDNHKFLVGG